MEREKLNGRVDCGILKWSWSVWKATFTEKELELGRDVQEKKRIMG